MPLEINNKTLTNSIISLTEFVGSVEVSFDALLQENIFLGAIEND